MQVTIYINSQQIPLFHITMMLLSLIWKHLQEKTSSETNKNRTVLKLAYFGSLPSENKSHIQINVKSAYESTILHNLGINEVARWQFWRNGHCSPSICALYINSSALLPWPRPRDRICTFCVLFFISWAKRKTTAVMSIPIQYIK